MDTKLQEIINNSNFEIISGSYIYVQVKSAPDITNHFMVSRDASEITVVTKKENLSSLDVIEKNKDYYSLISLNVSIPFYSVGFLATVSSTIAKEGMDILIISTYSKDYIMVREDLLKKTKTVLLSLGFKQK